jgi:hypothetical protein
MTAHTATAAACAALIIATAVAAGDRGTERSQNLRRERDRTLAVVTHLQDTVVPVKAFDEARLEDVLAWFRSQGITNMIVRWKSIQHHGQLFKDTPVTFTLADMKLSELLDISLELACDGITDEDQHLSYVIRNGVMIISTKANLRNESVIRLYDIDAAIQVIDRRDTRRSFTAYHTRTLDGGGTINQNLSDASIRDIKAANLMLTIKSFRPETWAEHGGKGWVIRHGDRIVVKQCVEVHEMIGGVVRENPRK